ncbi:RNA polymerase sigma factor, sigma-70 family [Lentzea albidocapillata subsp. violacea]|uniref:RNA polymerase sigma factor, sigma-70 family n=1 Tax=Lentzea albidocapillata subsp. violacea TaxID=128104 RepID=A0A1G8X9U6_9PSEU|nr:tetratricopeptide repeat protein [Lentzea albidocapillata]SDJ87428.1 RNA polymerase sigma factor, sigma-70 family [Lentzea albidocapillata subsp. violacea]
MTSNGRCALCDGTMPPATSEQRRSYCSNACRQRAYRRRVTVSTATPVTRQNMRVLSNLPAARDTFVGRQQELSKLDQLLRRHRLVTLVGSAGAGKTRLALEAAGRLRRGRTDRVLLVALGEITASRDVMPALADALGVTVQSDEPLRDTVVETLVNMKVLVVLDNCEHLLDTCAELTDMLLNRCPGVRVLATSREALWITGEVSFHVEGLPVPSTDRDLVTTAAPRSEAVKLFVDRARERKPDFRLTLDDTAAVALLCARLEGMPLAIELAARWVQLLPVTAICDRMDEPLELLTLGCRKSPSRQSSLREAIDWSYQLLRPDEQFALRRLSVFDGGFDLAAANEVCSSERSAEPVLDVLSRLQAKSLLAAIPGTTRFRQLETIRLHAKEKLLAAGELDVAYEALARWFTDLSDVLITAPLSMPADVQHKLDNHVDSLLGTVEWAADRADERLLLLTAALADCTARRGLLGQARVMLRDALRRPSTRDDYRCVALNHAARFAAEQGDHDEAAELSAEASRLVRDIGQPALVMSSRSTLAAVQQSSGEWEASVENNTECLRVAELLGEPLARATALVDLARTALSLGKHERAEKNVMSALPISRASGVPARIASALNTRGAVALVQGDLDEATHAFQEALRMDGLNPMTAPDALEGLAVVALTRGQAERALRLEATGRAMRRSVGVVPNPFWAEKVAGAMRTARLMLPVARAEAAATPLTAADTEAFIQDEVWLDRTEAAFDSLDDHERRVIALLASGLTNQQIANRLNVSVRTVASRLQRLRDKLGLRSREDIAAWGAERAIG